MKISHGLSPPSGARISIKRSPSTLAPRSRKASRCGSRRRRPIVSPPGGGIVASPKRASSGPASRNEARILAASASSTAVSDDRVGLQAELVRRRASSTLTPRPSSSAICVSVSRIRGTLRSTSSSSVSRQAARIGRAAFLFPAAVISPESGAPPWMTNFSIGAARVTSPRWLSRPREEAWELVCEWVESDSLRKHLLAVEAAMRRLRPQSTARTRSAGRSPASSTTSTTSATPTSTTPGHPRIALRSSSELGYPQDVIDAVAGHATFLGVPRETEMAKTLFAVDELSGFVAACALVRPTGIEGMKPKSVRKKLKQPSFAAGGRPRRDRAGRRGARRRLRRAHRRS